MIRKRQQTRFTEVNNGLLFVNYGKLYKSLSAKIQYDIWDNIRYEDRHNRMYYLIQSVIRGDYD